MMPATPHIRRKRFFFEKKKQKTFGPAGVGTRAQQPAGAKVFLLLFFQKKKILYSVALARPARRGCRLSPA
jgi:hypothetical protein